MKAPVSATQRRLNRASSGTTAANLRAASQQHLDARRDRLAAYEATLVVSLRTAMEKDSGGANAARFERQLEQVRKELHAASRPRLPRLDPPPLAAPPDAAPSIDVPAPLDAAAQPHPLSA